jgi:hypothetical protein
MLAGPILVAIMSLPGCYKDKRDERVPDHLARVAYALGQETKDVDEAAALATIAYHESRYCLKVQEKYTRSGAYSSWQLEGKRHLYPQPFVGLDYEPIHNAAYAAVDIWRRTYNCGYSFRDRMTSYAGRACGTNWPTLDARVGTYWYVRSVIVKEIKKHEQQ